jgi:peptide deformylase
MDCSGGKDPKDRIAFINPVINETKETQVGDEGCLSFPDIYFQVERPRIVTVTAFDVNGKEFTMKVEDLAARCVLHETDHLYGKLFTDFLKKLSFLKRDKIKKKIDKKIKYGEWD